MFQEIQFRAPAAIFGMDTISQVGQEAKKLGAGRVLVVTGPRVKDAGILDKALSFLDEASIDTEANIQDRDTPEPSADMAEETAQIAKDGNFDVIVGLGGGSILDVAKMASALMCRVTAGDGGGVYAGSSVVLDMQNCTFAGDG